MSTAARPGLARTLLRASKQAGTDAARSQDQAGRQRAERAVSRTLGRLGHWADARNPEGVRQVTGRRWVLVGSIGAAVALLAAIAVRGRRRGPV